MRIAYPEVAHPEVFESFLPNHPFRRDMWTLITRCVQPEPELRPTIVEVVERLKDINSVVSVRSNDASQLAEDKAEPILDNLSAQIKKVDDLPVAAGGFSEVWKGQRLGKDFVALKVLRMYDVPAKIRKVGVECLLIYALFRKDSSCVSEVFH